MTHPVATRTRAVDLYRQTGSARKAARECGVSLPSVLQWARYARVPVPGRGRPRKVVA